MLIMLKFKKKSPITLSFFNFIGVQLIYNAVLVSVVLVFAAVQQSESVIHISAPF